MIVKDIPTAHNYTQSASVILGQSWTEHLFPVSKANAGFRPMKGISVEISGTQTFQIAFRFDTAGPLLLWTPYFTNYIIHVSLALNCCKF